MQSFLKLDMTDEDEPKLTTVQAENLEALLEAETAEYQKDDSLDPCFGLSRAECLSHDNDSIRWAPGDGGQYTIVVYAPDTPEGREEINSWLDETPC